MRFLLIDTAFESGLAAIFEDGKIIQEIQVPLFANQSKRFFPLLHQLLLDANIPLHTLDFIASGIGPGSYTGMRVGAMIAKTFAYTLQKPLVGVCSLQGLPSISQGPFAALIDARISGAYILHGNNSGGVSIFETTPQAVELDQLSGTLKDVPVLVTTPGNRIKLRFESQYPEKQWRWEEQHPSAQSLGLAAIEAYKQGRYSKDARLDLLYLRATQAELGLKTPLEAKKGTLRIAE